MPFYSEAMKDASMSTSFETQAVDCSAGQINLPLDYEDGSLLGMIYAVDVLRASELLPTGLLKPVTLFGRALALVIAFDYRRSSLGPYREFGIGVLAQSRAAQSSALWALTQPHHLSRAGWFIVQLPVTSELARASGVEIWGYPKYTATIATDFAPAESRIALGGELEIVHSGGKRITLRSQPIVTLTLLGERLLRTELATRCRLSFGGPGRTELRILGDGPTSVVVDRLGLGHRRPLVTFRTDQFQSSLPAGKFLD
jgi:hypothetical protein